jgi:predicted RNA-binding Zn ribbon-like protein
VQGKTVKSRFLWVGNWQAVDFVNTDIVLERRPVDLLGEPADLTAWLSEAGVDGVDKALASQAKQDEILRKAKAYRALLRGGLVEITCRRALPIALLKATNAMLAQEKPVERLTESVTGYQLLIERRFERPASFIAPIAESFAKLLVEGDLCRLRKCKNENCVLYFYDTSKSGTRSWCSLDICGNKMRMAASRERNRV